MRPSSIPVLAALLLPAPGCCSLARLFCGPDKTPWVSVDHSTPEDTVKTLLEALRRDDPEQVYWALSSEHRRRLGLDHLKVQLAWVKVREQYPWLHVAGYADVPPAEKLGPDLARVELSIEGTPVVVDLVRTLRWTVRYARPAIDPNAPERFLPNRFGNPGDPGEYVVSDARLFTVVADDVEQRSTLTIKPLVFKHEGLDEVPADAIESGGFVREWKVDRLTTP